jgi:hypothetical protein
MASAGFTFANPQPSPDNYSEFDPKDVFADSGVTEIQAIEAIPQPRKTPPVMALSDVPSSESIQAIQNAGKIVFHSVGDTGGVKEPSHQFAVADAMSADIGTEVFANGRSIRVQFYVNRWASTKLQTKRPAWMRLPWT